MTQSPQDSPGGIAFVELIRLAVVILGTAVASELSTQTGLVGTTQLAVTVLGAAVGYVAGGVLGRFTQGQISDAERNLQRVAASEIIAGTAGLLMGSVMGMAVTWPVLLFGGKVFTFPLAAIVMVIAAWTGMRVGRNRAGDLLRFVGAGGRLPSNSRASGDSYKLVDTSALIDGRLVQVCRDGWMEGVLLVPEFVLYELQGLADSEDPDRRRRGQRGLDTLASLQQLSSIGVDVLDDDPGGTEVDTKLLKVAKRRGTPVVTTDSNLARVAEVQGLSVRNLHTLADGLRPPVRPGDVLQVRVSKAGREDGQGVGYQDDGTMVVIEGAAGCVGQSVPAEITSLMSNAHGRMLFATMVDRQRARSTTDRPRLVPDEDAG